MSDDREKPVWPWIVALLIGLPVLYVASFGPACWLAGRNAISLTSVARIYPGLIRTVLRQCRDPHKPVSRVVYGYLSIGSNKGDRVPLECWLLGEVAP